RDLPARRSGAPAPRRVRRPAGGGSRGGARPRQRRGPVGHVHDHPRHGGHPLTIVERPDGTPDRVSPPTSAAAQPSWEANRRPPPTAAAAERYWEATRAPRLERQWCVAGARALHFPREACPSRLGDDLEFRVPPGTGTVHALRTMPVHGNPTMKGRTPYAVALV